jgi:hypothetical protein
MPEGAGTATIRVTAYDGEATSEALDISVTVRAAANLAPRTTTPLPDRKIQIASDDSDNLTIDLSKHFEDTDGPQLFYNVTEVDDDADADVIELHATADGMGAAPNGTNFDKKVTIAPNAAGTATVTVTATDFGNKSVSGDFMVTVVAEDGNTNPSAIDVSGTAGVIADVDSDATRLKVGGVKTVIDGKKISEYFDDANFTGRTASRESGETLTFSVKYFEDSFTEGEQDNQAIGSAMALAPDAVTVSAVVSPETWNGDINSTFTLTLTGLKASTSYDGDEVLDAHAVALIATDEYGRMAARVFHVRVNHKPKAEGPQSTPKTLSAEKKYYDPPLEVRTGDRNTHTVMLTGSDGYFSDDDDAADIASCRRTGAPATDSVATIAWTGATMFTIAPKADGTMSVTVDCVDAAGERSDSDTLRITVMGTAFSQR